MLVFDGALQSGEEPVRKLGRARPLGLCSALLGGAIMASCFRLKPSSGGGENAVQAFRKLAPEDIAVEGDYVIEVVARGLTYPTQVTFDERGALYVVEAGYSYDEVFTTPRLLRVDSELEHPVIATGQHPPWTGVVYRDGSFFVAEGEGRIVRIQADGSIQPVVEGLPSMGDHHTNGPVLGPDGSLYFSQGVITNSGVVGVDNYEYGWLKRKPDLHDVPCQDVTLAGQNFTSDNPLTPDESDKATTGAFVPFGTPTTAGQLITGRVPCSGAVFKVARGGGDLELVAWGFRNPYGLAFAPDGQLYVTENAFDDRGSRPLFGTPDVLWKVEAGHWYGWPDYTAGRRLSEQHRVPGKAVPRPLLATAPEEPPQPLARLAVHSSSSGFDISRGGAFGQVGQAFIAQFGDMAPQVGKVWSPVGFKVVRVELETGVIHDFAINRGAANGPASAVGGGGFERPVAARFDPAGGSLYVVDFGIMLVDEKGPKSVPNTGVVWRIRPRAASSAGGAP
jgi:glucose/arabinose dehydrogenase